MVLLRWKLAQIAKRLMNQNLTHLMNLTHQPPENNISQEFVQMSVGMNSSGRPAMIESGREILDKRSDRKIDSEHNNLLKRLMQPWRPKDLAIRIQHQEVWGGPRSIFWRGTSRWLRRRMFCDCRRIPCRQNPHQSIERHDEVADGQPSGLANRSDFEQDLDETKRNTQSLDGGHKSGDQNPRPRQDVDTTPGKW